MKRVSLGLMLTVALCVACGADWPRFLGLAGNNATGEKLLDKWAANENVAWKVALPGFGGSTTVTHGDRIFLTAYSGYAIDQDKPGEQDKLTFHVICVDGKAGKIAWDRTIKADLPETDYRGFIALHGYASSSPVTDGTTVYSFFGRTGVFAHDMAGKELWHAKVGDKTHGWGSAASPILVGDLLIVNASVESGTLFGLNKSNGKVVWKLDGIKDSWSTPAVIELANGKKEIVVNLHSKAFGVDPATGEKLWECDAVPDYVCPSVVAKGDVAIISGGRKPVTLAVRGGGRGNVTATHKLWEIAKSPKVPTPVWSGDFIYWVNDAGNAVCIKASDGSVVYERSIKGLGKVYATLLVAGDRLYLFSREKGAVVLAANDEMKELARCELDDSSVFNASPISFQGRLLIRSDKCLYSLGK